MYKIKTTLRLVQRRIHICFVRVSNGRINMVRAVEKR